MAELTRAWLVWPARAEHHCGYLYARRRRRARRLALQSDPYRGPSWYLFEVRRLPDLDGLADWGTTIWEPADIPRGADPSLFCFRLPPFLHGRPGRILAAMRQLLSTTGADEHHGLRLPR